MTSGVKKKKNELLKRGRATQSRIWLGPLSNNLRQVTPSWQWVQKRGLAHSSANTRTLTLPHRSHIIMQPIMHSFQRQLHTTHVGAFGWNCMQFSHCIRGVGVSGVTPDLCASKYNKSNLKQGAHIHQTAAWPAPHACAQLYHPGSDSHGQLFRPYWGSSAWHSRRL